jgi:hypothetical protein
MKKLILTLMLFSSAVSADWFYDAVEAIDDAGIAVSGVIVDGVNDIPTAIATVLVASLVQSTPSVILL